MKRAKLILPRSNNDLLQGRHARLVDADTGEELTCCQDITLSIPLDGVIVANTNIVISEVEVVGESEV